VEGGIPLKQRIENGDFTRIDREYEWSNYLEKRYVVKTDFWHDYDDVRNEGDYYEKKKKILVELPYFEKGTTPDDVVKFMSDRGFRPGTVEELLAFGKSFPEAQLEFRIRALGTIGYHGGHIVTELGGGGPARMRCLYLSILLRREINHGRENRFLAV
jgi:hypothetical protein